MAATDLHVLPLTDTLIGFYAGRVPVRAGEPPQHAAEEGAQSWVDDGALSLGICSYAILDGATAVVYDTHVSVPLARRVRERLEGLGARRIRVVLSHWHLDHVAGNEAFADCEIISNRVTADLLAEHRDAIEAGTLSGPPEIAPLVLPTTTFEDRMHLDTPNVRVELVQLEIHSRDATVLYLPDQGLLLAGDTVEDTVTYVAEASRLEAHLSELERMRRLGARRLLPNHGSRKVIERDGYAPTLIDATQNYIRDLLASAGAASGEAGSLRQFVQGALDAGWITWWEPYERVHRANLAAMHR